MSTPRLPAELLDHIVDDLRSTNDALKNCCLVSKSWIPRTRQHLFCSIDLSTEAILQSWKQTFPNPSTSPACYTKLLVIRCPQVVTVVDAEDGGWLSAFSRVECLVIVIPIVGELKISLAPFHGLSPVTKSLRIVLAAFQPQPSPSRVFDFICSFPLLEDLSVDACERFANPDGSDGQQTPVQIPNPPKFSGLLELSLAGGLNPFICRFLSLPSDLHFRILTLTCVNEGDISLVAAMVGKCCHTLEYLRIYDRLHERLPSGHIDLSKAEKLESVALTGGKSPQWITATFRTITPNHKNLRLVSLGALFVLPPQTTNPTDAVGFGDAIGERTYAGWLELDGVLAQLWETHSIRPEVYYDIISLSVDDEIISSCVDGRCWMESLLPGVSRRKIVDLAEGVM